MAKKKVAEFLQIIENLWQNHWKCKKISYLRGVCTQLHVVIISELLNYEIHPKIQKIMAKGNLFLSQARGKVGSVVFTVIKGQQIERVYNASPANPRSSGQQAQRALLGNMVKFYKRATSKFYKFAYEDKSNRESDYNAFARHNIKRGVYLDRMHYESPYSPALGKYIISQGSIATNYTPIFLGEEFGITLPSTTALTTIGAFSTAMLAANPAVQEGDIVTWVLAFSTLEPNLTYGDTAPDWRLLQFKVDPSDTTTLASIGLAYDNTLKVCYYSGEDTYGGITYCAMGAVVISRNTSSGLKVSNTEITLSSAAYVTTDWLQGEYARRVAAASWGSEGDAILQGSLIAGVPEVTEVQFADARAFPGYTYVRGGMFMNDVSLLVLGNGLKSTAEGGDWRMKFYIANLRSDYSNVGVNTAEFNATAAQSGSSQIAVTVTGSSLNQLLGRLNPGVTVQMYYLLSYNGVPVTYGLSLLTLSE